LVTFLQNSRRWLNWSGDLSNGQRRQFDPPLAASHVRPAAKSAKIEKVIGWHAFRHLLGTWDRAGMDEACFKQDPSRLK